MSDIKKLAFELNILGTDGQLDKLTQAEKKIIRLTEGTKHLKKAYEAGELSQDEYAAAVGKANAQLKVARRQKNEVIKTIDLENKRVKSANTSYNSLSATYSLMKKRINEMTESQRKNTEEGRRLVKQSKEIREKMNQQQIATGNSSLNVGKYSEALSGLNGIFGRFGGQLGRQIQILTTMQGSMKEGVGILKKFALGTDGSTKALSRSSKALRIFRAALIATGIGAIVVLIGSLVAAFLSTQRGMDAVNKVLRPLQALFQRFVGFLQNVALGAFDGLKNAINNPVDALKRLGTAIKDNIINRFTALKVFAGAIQKIFSGDFKGAAKDFGNGVIQMTTGVTEGIDKLQKAGQKTGEFIQEAIEQGKRLDAIQKQIELVEIERIRRGAKLTQLAKESNKIADDTTKSFEERSAAAKRAMKLEQERQSIDIRYFDLLVKQKRLQNSLNDTSREDEKELAEIEKQRAEAITARVKAQTLYNTKLNTINTQAAVLTKQQLKAVEDAAKGNLKIALKIRDEGLAIKKDGLEKELATIQNKHDDETKLLRSQLITEEEINKAKGALKEELLKRNELINERILQLEEVLSGKLIKARKEDAEKTKALRLKELESLEKLEQLSVRNKVINETITTEQGEREILEIKKRYLKEKLALIDTETTEGKAAYQQLVNEIDQINNADGKKGLADLLSISDEDAVLIKQKAFALASEISQTIATINSNARKAQLAKDLRETDDAKRAELAIEDNRLERGLISQEQYTARKSLLEQEYDQKREDIERQAFERNKQASILAAAMAGSLAVLNVLATNKGGAISRAIEAGYVIAQTALQIAEIRSQEFAEGGLVQFSGERVPQGARNIRQKRNGDNVLATVKEGEVVLNDEQQEALGGDAVFRAIGVPGFSSGGYVKADGALVLGSTKAPDSFLNPLLAPGPLFNTPSLQNTKLSLSGEQLESMVATFGSIVEARIQGLRISEYEVSKAQNNVETIQSESNY